VNGIDPNCVPYNIFSEGGVTAEALNYLQTPGFSKGHVNETIANANVTLEGGEYGIQTPWSDRGVGLNVGAEYRKEALDFRVDEEFRTGDLAGSGGPTPPVSGHFDVRELFAEVQLPIVSHSFFEELTLGAGYRYSDYKVANNHFSTDTYKLSAEFAPIHDVRARASYNRAVRAPNVVELFTPRTIGLAGGTDPCAGANPRFTVEQCFNTFAGTGFTLADVRAIYGNIPENPASQYGGLFGGSADLKPETADTYTVGLVLQPRWIPGFAFTVDYFDIKVVDLIGTYGFTNVLNQCAQTGDPAFCSLIHRDRFGSLTLTPQGFVQLTNVNTGGLRTKGFDINGSYSRRLGGLGTLNVSLVGTYLKDLDINPFGDIEFDCASYYGATCGTPNPKWRHKLRAGFTLPMGLGISGQWRYFSSVTNDTTSDDPDMPAGNDFPGNHKLNARSYFDLALTARLADKFNFRFGANNILDTDPPVAGSDVVVPPFGNGNTFPQVYDSMGRFLFAGVTVDF
jgi:outer membrane receptor protein involved in Fe transport